MHRTDTSQLVRQINEKEREKRRPFQRRGPATVYAQSPYVDSLVRRTIKLNDDAERSLRRLSSRVRRMTEFIS